MKNLLDSFHFTQGWGRKNFIWGVGGYVILKDHWIRCCAFGPGLSLSAFQVSLEHGKLRLFKFKHYILFHHCLSGTILSKTCKNIINSSPWQDMFEKKHLWADMVDGGVTTVIVWKLLVIFVVLLLINVNTGLYPLLKMQAIANSYAPPTRLQWLEISQPHPSMKNSGSVPVTMVTNNLVRFTFENFK